MELAVIDDAGGDGHTPEPLIGQAAGIEGRRLESLRQQDQRRDQRGEEKEPRGSLAG
jgi:hypothetical protein